MRRLFLLLDLALLRDESANERQAVLRQVQIVLARLWAASYRAGTGEFSWGYALVDSTVSELSLKARLRRTAAKLGLPPAFQEPTSEGGLRGADLSKLALLLDAATDPAFQEQLRTRTSDAHARASPAAALAAAAQAALSSSYLQKLRQVAEDESQLDIDAVDGALVLLTLPLQALGAADGAGAALLPPDVWAKAQQCRMQICWLVGGDASAKELAALATAVRGAGVSAAAAASLAAIAAPGLGRAAFSELLPLPAMAPAQGQEATSAVPAEDEALAWLADLDEDVPMPNLLHALVSNVEGCSEREREAIRREIQKRMRQQQRAAVGGVPPGACPVRGGSGTAAARKGQRALQQAQLLQARGKENRPGSRPASMVPPTTAAAAPDEWWAEDEAGEEEDEEVSSVMPLDPPTAAAELQRQLAALEEELATAAGTAEEERGVGGAAAVLDGREMSRRVQAAVEAAFRAMAKHHRQGAGTGVPPLVEQHRALLLSRAGMSVAELHRRHSATKPPLPDRPTQAERDAAHAVMRRALPGVAATCMLQALLRLHVAAYGTRGEQEITDEEGERIHSLLQLVCATLSPIPMAGHEFFSNVFRPRFARAFPSELSRLAREMGLEEELELNYDALARQRAAQLAQDIGNEVSGETPDARLQQSDTVGTASQGGGGEGAAASDGAGPQPSSSLVTSTTGRARGPSLLGPSSRAAGAPPGGGAGRQDQSRQGTQAAATGGGRSSSMLSGSHSGVAGGGSVAATTAAAAAAAAGGARSGAAAARQTATSCGVVPGGWDHLRMRYNNTKALAYQVPAKLPSKVVQQQRLLAAARRPPVGPAGAVGGPSRGARLVASSQQAAAAAATRRGSGNAAACQGLQQQSHKAADNEHPALQQQVPESPTDDAPLPGAASAGGGDARAAAPPSLFNAVALAAEAAMDGDLPGHNPCSPEDAVADTDARPPLLASSRLPALLSEAAAGGIATQKRLFVGHVPSQYDGGSTTSSPTHGAPAAQPLHPGGGWLVPAVTRAIRAAPARPSAAAVAALGHMAVQHVAPPAAATAAEGEAGAEPMDSEEPVASEPAAVAAAEPVAAPVAVPERRRSARVNAEPPVAEEAVEHAAAGEPEQQGQQQDTKQGRQQATTPGRKQNTARRKSGCAAETAATTAERRRTRSAAATDEAAEQPAQQEAEPGSDDASMEAAAPAAEPERRRTRASAAAEDLQASQVNETAAPGAGPERRRTRASSAAEAEPARAAAPKQSPDKAAPKKLWGAAARSHKQRLERDRLEAQLGAAEQAWAAEYLPAERAAQAPPAEPMDMEPAGEEPGQPMAAAPALPEQGSAILYVQPPPGSSSDPMVVKVGVTRVVGDVALGSLLTSVMLESGAVEKLQLELAKRVDQEYQLKQPGQWMVLPANPKAKGEATPAPEPASQPRMARGRAAARNSAQTAVLAGGEGSTAPAFEEEGRDGAGSGRGRSASRARRGHGARPSTGTEEGGGTSAADPPAMKAVQGQQPQQPSPRATRSRSRGRTADTRLPASVAMPSRSSSPRRSSGRRAAQRTMAEAALPPDTSPESTEAEEGEPEAPVGALPPSPAAAAEPQPDAAAIVPGAAEAAKLRRQRKQEEQQAQQQQERKQGQRVSVGRGRKRGSAAAAAEEPEGPAAQGPMSGTAAEAQGLGPAAKRCKSSGGRVAAAARSPRPKPGPSPASRRRSARLAEAPAAEAAAVEQAEQQQQNEQVPMLEDTAAAKRAAAAPASPASPPGAPEMAELAAAQRQVEDLLRWPALAGVLGADADAGDGAPAEPWPGDTAPAAADAAAAAAGQPAGIPAAAAGAGPATSELNAPSCLAELLQAEVIDLPGSSLLATPQALPPPDDAAAAVAAQPEQAPEAAAAAAAEAIKAPAPGEPAEQQPAAKKQRLQGDEPTAEAAANATPPAEAGAAQAAKRPAPASGGGSGPRHRKGRLLGMLAGVSKSAGTSGLSKSGGRSLGKTRRGGEEVVQRPRSTPGGGAAAVDVCSPAGRRLSNASNGAAALAAAKAAAALVSGSPYSGAFDFPAPEEAAAPADEGYGSVGEDEDEATASAVHGRRRPKKAATKAMQQQQQQQQGGVKMTQEPAVGAAAAASPAEAEHAPVSPARPSQQQQQQQQDAALAKTTQPTLPEQQQQRRQDSGQATAVEESLQQLSPDVAGPAGAGPAGPPSAAPTPQSRQQRLSPPQAKQQQQQQQQQQQRQQQPPVSTIRPVAAVQLPSAGARLLAWPKMLAEPAPATVVGVALLPEQPQVSELQLRFAAEGEDELICRFKASAGNFLPPAAAAALAKGQWTYCAPAAEAVATAAAATAAQGRSSPARAADSPGGRPASSIPPRPQHVPELQQLLERVALPPTGSRVLGSGGSDGGTGPAAAGAAAAARAPVAGGVWQPLQLQAQTLRHEAAVRAGQAELLWQRRASADSVRVLPLPAGGLPRAGTGAGSPDEDREGNAPQRTPGRALDFSSAAAATAARPPRPPYAQLPQPQLYSPRRSPLRIGCAATPALAAGSAQPSPAEAARPVAATPLRAAATALQQQQVLAAVQATPQRATSATPQRVGQLRVPPSPAAMSTAQKLLHNAQASLAARPLAHPLRPPSLVSTAGPTAAPAPIPSQLGRTASQQQQQQAITGGSSPFLRAARGILLDSLHDGGGL